MGSDKIGVGSITNPPQWDTIVSSNGASYTYACVPKDRLDPKFLAEIEQLKKMVHELYYPMVPYVKQ